MTALGEVRARRAQQVTVLYAVMACLALLVGVQWILLSVAVDGFLGARHDVLSASTAASGVCFVAACWAFRFLPGRAEPARAPSPNRTGNHNGNRTAIRTSNHTSAERRTSSIREEVLLP